MKKTIYILFGAAMLLSFAIGEKSGWTVINKTEIETATKKISNFYEVKKTYAVTVTHQTFIGHHETVPHDQSKGYLKRNGSLYHSFMVGVHSCQDEVVSFTVDSLSKTIIVADRKNMEATNDIKLETLATQENAISFKKSEINGKQSFRVDYNKNHPIEATELHLNNDYSLGEIVIYFHDEMPVKNEENSPTAKGKAKIIYSGYNLNPAFIAKDFSHKKYFLFKDKRAVLTTGFSKYKLIDNRIQKNQKND